jgi:hypothetical protein
MEEQPQSKKSFFRRFWWIWVILGIGLIIFAFAAYNGLKHDKELQNQNKQSSTEEKSKKQDFGWPSKTAKTITSVPLDLTQIKSISKFRSCAGHDRAGYNFNQVLETDRSMKHYLYPVPEFQGTLDKVKMYTPFDGTVAMIQWVSPDGSKVRSDWLRKDGSKEFGQTQKAESGGRKNSGNDIDFVSPLDENAVFGFRHVVFAKDFKIGDKVKAGELIGYASISEKVNDFDIDYVAREYKTEGNKYIEVLDSVFDHMTPEVLAEFAKFDITPENTKFTQEERDAKPCGYDPQTKYGSTACQESERGQDGSGRNNDCWVQFKH